MEQNKHPPDGHPRSYMGILTKLMTVLSVLTPTIIIMKTILIILIIHKIILYDPDQFDDFKTAFFALWSKFDKDSLIVKLQAKSLD